MTIDPNRLTVINKALYRAGCLPLDSAASLHPSGAAVTELFDLVLKNMLSYPWHFAKRTKKLGRLVAAPTLHWKYAFDLPSDRIGPPIAAFDAADCRQPFWGFELVGAELHSDAADVWVRDAFVPAPGLWPGYFDDCFTLGLAAEYASAIREDWNLRTNLLRELYGPPDHHGQGGRFQLAKTTDSQAEPGQQPAAGYDPFTALFRSGG